MTLTATADADTVHIAVRDTGKGIPPAEIPRLFERFYQVDRSRSERGQHVGLGLAIVREIVEAHGGQIAVASTWGAGTTVTVGIPRGMSSGGRTAARYGGEGRPGSDACLSGIRLLGV